MNGKEFIIGMLGSNQPQDFFHSFVWALVGLVISFLLNLANRDPMSQRTPFKFSAWFAIRDNAPRLLLAILLIIVTLRFAPDLLGMQLSGAIAAIVGFGHDKLAQLLKNKRDLLFPSPIPKQMNTTPACFPTIDPDQDMLTKYLGTPLSTPMTARDLEEVDSRFRFEQDDEDNDVLVVDKDDSGPMPTIEGLGFPIQTAEFFIGPRPNRRRPRPTEV